MHLKINSNQNFKIYGSSKCYFLFCAYYCKLLAISPITLFHAYCSMVIKLGKIVELGRKSSYAIDEVKCIKFRENLAMTRSAFLFSYHAI